MIFPLDGPSVQTKITVDTITVQEIKVGGSPLDERKVITVQPIDGDVKIYFGDEDVAAPNAATVASDGFIQFKRTKDSYEAAHTQPIYILAESGTVDVIITERA